jgi:ATP-dependent Lon protease
MSSASQTPEGSEQMTLLPVLPVKNAVLFPYLVIPLTVARQQSLAAVNAALTTPDKRIIVATQRDSATEFPHGDDLYSVATEATIKNLSRNDEGVEFLVQGSSRVVIVRIEETDPQTFLRARVRSLPLPDDSGPEVEALQRAVAELAQRVLEMSSEPQAQFNVEQLLREGRDPLWLAYLAGSLLSIDVSKRQALLEAHTRAEALRMAHG